jgi:2,3-bisphosphoglycerate-dependent phosphoglycerate mutase
MLEPGLLHRLDVTLLTLIRHAHVSPGSPEPRLQGWFDPPLSRSGIEQVTRFRRLGLLMTAPAALYSSTLVRATQTAEALAVAWQVPLIPEPDFREIHCGRLEGMPLREVAALHPELWARNLAQEDDEFGWPEGESYVGFRARVLGALGALAARHSGQRVAVVTHAGVINQVVGVARGRRAAEWETFRPDPLSATEILWQNGAPQVEWFNRRLE